ncbi:hypothetical protein [Streptomyces sp. NPDC094437]|uniref:hypothetical protein n=1 Tax=Streptomyces sp. NPDC094437 TaxID=3366060 RepID=UPI0038232816
MSVGGAGIPRLQELSYIETAATAVARGKSFEQIRLAMVNQAEEVARKNDRDGSFDTGKWVALRSDYRCYVHNTVDVLKELMRLGWVERHTLPSSPQSAFAHAHVVFETTHEGREWTELVSSDVRAGYNALVGALLNAHPQFDGFLRLVGARPESQANHLTIPLLRWEGAVHSEVEDYLRSFITHMVNAVQQGQLGWTAKPEVLENAVRGYVTAAVNRATTRIARHAEQRRLQEAQHLKGAVVERGSSRVVKPPPPLTHKRIAALCEEAAVRLAFTSAGCPMDYISHELLRRWSRFMGLANFSYYAPGTSALRLWATGSVVGSGAGAVFQRSVGPAVRKVVLAALPRICQAETDRSGGGTGYCAVWRIRAATCWEQRVSDEEFDAALISAYRGDFPDLPFRVHLDEASSARTPGSARPLYLDTSSGIPRVIHVMRLYGNSREGVAVL